MTTGTSSATAAPPDPDESPDPNSLAVLASTAPVGNSIGDYTRNYLSRLRGGDMGSLPAITGLVALIILFSILQPSFASLYNTAVLLTEGSGPIVIAMGLVFVLLLGEIDLSAGYAAGVCAAVMVRVMVGYNAPWPVSIGLALLTGIVIGILIGLLRAKLRIPSFVVTLAFFLAFQGVVLYILNNGKGQQGNVSVTDNLVNGINNGQMPLWAGWLFAVLCVLLYAGVKLSGSRSRRRAGLSAEPTSVLGLKIAGLAVLVFGMVYVLNQNRAIVKTASIENVNGQLVRVPPPRLEGVPWVIPLVVTLLVIGTFVLTRTRYGRHVYAVGGNAEAARRAGIDVARIRTSVFVISSTMAAIGGIALASRANSVDPNTGGSNTLLYAVGAAVIGGTSLFGGKGRVRDAVLGALVIAVIDNGMGLLGYSAGLKLMITGVVLLLAAGVDALSRRRAAATGRA